MTGLVAAVEVDGVWTEAGARTTSQVGTPLVSAEVAAGGLMQPDDYVISFSGVDPGASAVATLSAAMDETNPYHGRSAEVALDGSTEETGLLPGVSLVFSASGSFSSSWQASLTVGLPLGRLAAGDGRSGSTQVRVQNTGAAGGKSCSAEVVTSVRAYPKAGTMLSYAGPFAEDAASNMSGGEVAPYELVASGVSGSGPSKTADVALDGSPLEVTNLSTEDEGDSTGIGVADRYQVRSGLLRGLVFRLSEAVEDGDATNVFVFDASIAEVSADDGGTPTSWGQGPVELTQDGEDNGEIAAGGSAYFHFRTSVPGLALSGSNPYPVCFRIRGSAALAAGWTA